MRGRSAFYSLIALALAAGNAPAMVPNRATSLSRSFAAPYHPGTAWTSPSYPRKDRMNTAAQVKRASKKARGVAKHRRNA